MRISDWSSDVCSSDLMVWSLAAHSFPLFFTMVLLLFFVSGVGNASTFQMVPGIMRAEIDRTSSAGDPDERRLQADRESAAVIGFISAIAAYGAFYIPKAYRSEEHTSELQSLMRISYAVFCLKK